MNGRRVLEEMGRPPAEIMCPPEGAAHEADDGDPLHGETFAHAQSVPEAHPPAITIPIPNMVAPMAMWIPTGEINPGTFSAPLSTALYWMAAKPAVATANAMITPFSKRSTAGQYRIPEGSGETEP